jgi:hypothetical protein
MTDLQRVHTTSAWPGVIEYVRCEWPIAAHADDCIVTMGFINRKASISGETTLPITCWNKCYNCGENANITINMGFPAANPPSPDGVYIAGGSRFEAPGGKYKMTDSDGDGIYSITINRVDSVAILPRAFPIQL